MQSGICWKYFALQCLPFYYELLTYQSATLFFSKMTSKRKAYVSADQQQRILQQFYDDLDNDSFLGHSFEGENDANSFSDDDSDESPVENDSPGESDGPIKIENEIDMGLDENAPVDDSVDNTPRKQKFSNLDDVLNLDNYDQLPQQEYALYFNIKILQKHSLCSGKRKSINDQDNMVDYLFIISCRTHLVRGMQLRTLQTLLKVFLSLCQINCWRTLFNTQTKTLKISMNYIHSPEAKPMPLLST